MEDDKEDSHDVLIIYGTMANRCWSFFLSDCRSILPRWTTTVQYGFAIGMREIDAKPVKHFRFVHDSLSAGGGWVGRWLDGVEWRDDSNVFSGLFHRNGMSICTSLIGTFC